MNRAGHAMAVAVLTAMILGSGVAAGSPISSSVSGYPGGGNGSGGAWRLVRAENFNRPLKVRGDTGWFPSKDEKDTEYDVDAYDNDGEFFQTFGGEAFRKHLATMDLYRRSYNIGKGGWLTVELAARDRDRDGTPDGVPTFARTKSKRMGSVGTFTVPDHNSAAILRSTEALPEEYRVEVTLRAIDFGGQRNGSWDYDGKTNGYGPGGCKTNFPWAGSPGADYNPEECDWFDVTGDSNGYYFLSIMDHPVAPHNNVFVHQRRKVVMDGYNRYRYTGNGLRYCDPVSGTFQPYEWGSGNGVNMLFMTPFRRYSSSPGTQYLMKSECGTVHGGAIVSQVDMVPEKMPEVSYVFAIERRGGQYTLEVSGYFRNVGWGAYRYSQPFDDGEHPIHHYNQRTDEYDGRYNMDWTYSAGDKTFVDPNIWPAGSSYPDYFMIGIPHMNFYEGTASIKDVRLYIPR